MHLDAFGTFDLKCVLVFGFITLHDILPEGCCRGG